MTKSLNNVLAYRMAYGAIITNKTKIYLNFLNCTENKEINNTSSKQLASQLENNTEVLDASKKYEIMLAIYEDMC